MAEKDSKPKTTEKPAAKAKPATTTKPAASAKPASTAKPAASAKPATTAKPAANAKPTTTAKPAASAKPATAAKPAASAKPASPEKSTASAKPATAKSAAAKKPAKSSSSAQKDFVNEQYEPLTPVKLKADGTAENPRPKQKAEAVAAKAEPEKAKKQPKQKTAKNTDGGEAAVAPNRKKMWTIVLSAIAFLLVVAIVLGIALGARSCNSEKAPDGPILSTEDPTVLPATTVTDEKPLRASTSLLSPVDPDDPAWENSFNYEYTSASLVGFSGEVIGTTERTKPIVSDEHEYFNNPEYPKFGTTLSSVIGTDEAKVAARNALIAESSYLTATGTRNAGGGGYTWMDAEGKLYSGTTAAPEPTIGKDGVTQRKLYKHTASGNLYFGDVDDEEPAIVKKVTMRRRGYDGYGVTGVYAPAGEVITIQMTEADMAATGGVIVHIGQALYNAKANNIWAAKNQMQRIPHLLNTMTVNKNTATYDEETGLWTAYVGSFIGGPLYIRNENVTFSATISGGVKYQHFILGYTTEEEFAENANASAPYFDLEVWNMGVLHSGPKYYARGFTYEDIYKAAVLWEKVSTVTTTGSSQGIVFLYDPFVAAGAAVAFPGQRSVNCPAGWMRNSLNYNGIVTSGAWGNFHEYHHNFQGYGVGNGGEVTNNAMTLASYALFTKISAKRGITGFGSQGLGGWNNYTSATWALEETLKIARENENPSNGNQGLALYATLLHNFGADNFINAKITQSGGQNYTAYLKSWQNITHNDMTYYFKDILCGITAEQAAEFTNPEYPMFVPVSSVYQTGRGYAYDGEKRYFTTMQPYVIPYGVPFNIDLSRYTAPNGQYASGSVVIPEGFEYRIKSITQPEHGNIAQKDNFNFTFTPDKNMRSGKIVVTLEIAKKDNAFKVADVDLVLEFEQSHETNKMTLERTTYAYAADKMYTDAQEAFDSGYKGYESVAKKDHSNPTQNCNTDIWFYPDNEATREKYPDVPESYFVHDNTIEELSGKLYIEKEGKYRLYLRGRLNCALYYSLDGGNTYKLGPTIKDTKAPSGSHLFRPNDSKTYVDLDLEEDSWIYIKEVLIVQSTPSVSYIGVGLAQWTDPLFTMVDKYYDKDGNEVASADDENYDHTITHYYDYQGNEVSADVANAAEKIEPVVTDRQQPYVNAYRSDYEFPSNADFETDYFYVRTHNYNYSATAEGLTPSVVGPDPCHEKYPIENLFDSDPTNIISSKDVVSESAPWELKIDLGKVIEANRMEITGFLFGGNGSKNQTPNSITLYLGKTLDDMKEVISFDNGKVDGVMLKFNFETTQFRYYRLVVRHTVEGRFGSIAKIDFCNQIPGGTLVAPSDDAILYQGDWRIEQTQATFGHVFAGKKNATLTFEFTGSRVGFLASPDFGKNFEVEIDGQKMSSIELKEDNGTSALVYLTKALESGKHKVVLKCLGDANIDSIVVYP